MALIGYSLIDGAASASTVSFIVTLDPWDERTTPETGLRGIITGLMARFHQIPDAQIFAFPVPSIPGVGLVGGFDMQLQDRSGGGIANLSKAADALVDGGNQQPTLMRVNSSLRASVPQLYVDVDRDKVKQMGISLQTVFSTLQTYLGSAYANDFNEFGADLPGQPAGGGRHPLGPLGYRQAPHGNERRANHPDGLRGQGGGPRRARLDRPLQPLPERLDQGQRRAGDQLWPVAGHHRRGQESGAPGP